MTYSKDACERLASELEALADDVAGFDGTFSFAPAHTEDHGIGNIADFVEVEQALVYTAADEEAHVIADGIEQHVAEPIARILNASNSAPEVAAALRAAVAEVERLSTRQQELLATIVRVTNETPFPDEAKDALAQRGKLVAEIGTLRASLAALESLVEEACKVADGLVNLAAPGLDTFRDCAVTDIADIRERLAKEQSKVTFNPDYAARLAADWLGYHRRFGIVAEIHEGAITEDECRQIADQLRDAAALYEPYLSSNVRDLRQQLEAARADNAQLRSSSDLLAANVAALTEDVAKQRAVIERLTKERDEATCSALNLRTGQALARQANEAADAEIGRLRVEIERMRAVYEAAVAWHGWYGSDDEGTVRIWTERLWAAIDATTSPTAPKNGDGE